MLYCCMYSMCFRATSLKKNSRYKQENHDRNRKIIYFFESFQLFFLYSNFFLYIFLNN